MIAPRLLARFPRLLVRLKGGVIGCGSRVAPLIAWSHLKNLTIGEHVYIGPGARLFAMGGVTIGDATVVGPKLTIYSSNHNFFDAATIPYSNATLSKKSVDIGQGCWLGDSVMLMPGTQLGDHCLVGAGAVVRGTFAAGSIILGNPARAVKMLNPDILTQKREALASKRYLIGRKDTR